MRALSLALAASLFLSAGSPPPASITYTIQRGDPLPQYDGDLDRVEIVAVPGSRVRTVDRFWPHDGITYVYTAFHERGDYWLASSDVTVPWSDEPLLLYRGPQWTRDVHYGRDVAICDPDIADDCPETLTFPAPFVWPTPDLEEYHPAQWWHGFTQPAYVIENGWEDVVFSGTGNVGLLWGPGTRTRIDYRPVKHRETPTLSVFEDFALQVTYYPAP